eukprot:887660-Pleurochrysis_carterae.AAC.1
MLAVNATKAMVGVRSGLRLCAATPQARGLAVPAWATVDPDKMSGSAPGEGCNLVGGEWVKTARSVTPYQENHVQNLFEIFETFVCRLCCALISSLA